MRRYTPRYSYTHCILLYNFSSLLVLQCTSDGGSVCFPFSSFLIAHCAGRSASRHGCFCDLDSGRSWYVHSIATRCLPLSLQGLTLYTVARVAYLSSDYIVSVQPTLASESDFSQYLESFSQKKQTGIVSQTPEVRIGFANLPGAKTYADI